MALVAVCKPADIWTLDIEDINKWKGMLAVGHNKYGYIFFLRQEAKMRRESA